MSVFAPLMGLLWRTVESYGVDPREVIEEFLYRPSEAALATRRVSYTDWEEALDRAAAKIDDPAFGLRTARYLHPSHLGALGHAWLTSPSLRSAMQRFARLARIYNEQLEYSLTESPGQVRMACRLLKPSGQRDMVGDAQMGNLLQLCRMNFGPGLMPADVTLVRVAPADPAPWFEHFGPKVRFAQPGNSLALSAGDADEPLTGSNPELVAIHEELTERYLMRLDRDNVVNRLRLALIDELPSGRVTEDEICGRLHMSKSTLYRKLRENDQTFRAVLAQVRRDLAGRYVRDRDFSVTEIAFLLGYNDTSAFSRAFRNWFGCSPSEARERARTG